MKSIRSIFRILLVQTSLIALAGCSDLVDVDLPRTQIVSEAVFNDDQTAISAISGIYSTMVTSGFASGGSGSLTIQGGLSSDEYVDMARSTVSLQFSGNALVNTNPTITTMWANLYQYIFYANSVLEGLDRSTSLTPAVKSQLQGEARFVRAFAHFYLVNLFGDVPIVTSTDYKLNSSMDRVPAAAVLNQVVTDLSEAATVMVADYSHSSSNRVRPNKWAALALLSRVYLYQQNWSLAAATATEVLNNTTLYRIEPDLNKVFLRNSGEAIWQLMPALPQANTSEGSVFRSLSFASLSPQLTSAFAAGDQRATQWTTTRALGATTYVIPFKYKVGVTGQPVTEYSMVIRVAELYLIRAESRAQQSDVAGAIADLNVLRTRAALPSLTTMTQSEAMLAIESERRFELFSEWGHRWLDLKRTNRADIVFPAIKPDWQTTDALYPIPKTERDNNPNLSQNPGY